MVRVRLQIVVNAGESRSTGNAAQTEDRDALDIAPHPEPVDQSGIDGRGSDPGNAHEEERVYVRRLQSGGVKGFSESILADIGPNPDVVGVGFGEPAELEVFDISLSSNAE